MRRFFQHIICLGIGSLLMTGGYGETPDGAEAPKAPQHGVLREIWKEIKGNNVEDLTKSPSFQKAADEKTVVAQIDDFNLGDRFGARYSALLEVKETGDYTFYITSDDSSEFWLGKDATQNDMTCIAFVKGYTLRHNWANQVNQKSKPVRLEKGKKYYIYVLHKEAGSEDHVSVAWTGPGIKEPTIIPAEAFTLPPAPASR